MTAKNLRKKCEKDIKRLQETCNHPKSIWMEQQWATAHGTGVMVLVCNRCEKILKRREPRDKGEVDDEWFNK